MFCPNTGDATPVVMSLPGQRTLDGEIWIEWVELDGKTYWPHRGVRRPKWITAELLNRIRWAAAEAEYQEQRTTMEKFYGEKAALALSASGRNSRKSPAPTTLGPRKRGAPTRFVYIPAS